MPDKPSIRTGQLLDEARRRTGLSDFGVDGTFRTNLERLLASINRESDLSEYGVEAVPELLLKPLITRLRVEDFYRQHPEVNDERIVAPTIVIGLPRTGTTLLGFLLGLDPETRSLRYWESVIPYPPMLPGQEDPERIAEADLVHKQMRDLIPEILPMTPYDPRGPAECFELTQLSFDSNYALWVHCPSYMEWYLDPGTAHRATYAYHERVLKMLQWRWPKPRWSLRCPLHSFMLPDLIKTYPDARLIMSHRDPVKVIRSIAFQTSGVRTMFLGDSLPKYVGPQQLQMWDTALRAIRRFREIHPGRVIDVLHSELTTDPVREIRRLYASLDREFTESYAASIRDWREDHPRVVPTIQLEDYGLDEAMISERLKYYTTDRVLGFATARERTETA